MAKVIHGSRADVAGYDVAGYMVFKLGAAGVILGLAYGAAFGGSEALSTGITYALAVAVTGAFLGSLTWVGKAKRQTEDRHVPDLVPPGAMPDAAPEPARARVSAFRGAGRPAR